MANEISRSRLRNTDRLFILRDTSWAKDDAESQADGVESCPDHLQCISSHILRVGVLHGASK